MSNYQPLPDYVTLEKALAAAEIPFSPSHVHGYICGILSATGGRLSSSWVKDLLGKKKSKPLQEILLQLFETSYHLMNEFSFEFTILLPIDETDINVRSECLGSFCQAFLTGLEKFNIPLKNRKPSEITEAIDDLIEIAQVSYGDISTNDEDENAYFELVEYVRLAVLMIFHEINPKEGMERRRNTND